MTQTKAKLNDLIQDIVIKLHDYELFTDDSYDEALENQEWREQAIDFLIYHLEKMKEK